MNETNAKKVAKNDVENSKNLWGFLVQTILFSVFFALIFISVKITSVAEKLSLENKFELIKLHQDDPLLFSKVYQKVILDKSEQAIEEYATIDIDNINWKQYNEFLHAYRSIKVYHYFENFNNTSHELNREN